MLKLVMCLLQEPTIARHFSEEEMQRPASVDSWPQPVSPDFKMGFALLAMRVVEGDNTLLGSLFLVSR